MTSRRTNTVGDESQSSVASVDSNVVRYLLGNAFEVAGDFMKKNHLGTFARQEKSWNVFLV